MNDEFDLKRLAEIGDPFADDASAPIRPMDRRAPAGPLADAPPHARAALGRARRGAVVRRRVARLSREAPRPGLGGSGGPRARDRDSARRRGHRARGCGEERAAWPRRPGRHASRRSPSAAPVLFARRHGRWRRRPDGRDPLFWRHAAGCMTVTAILALGPMALGLWAFRHAFAAAAGWRTAAIGWPAGALSRGDHEPRVPDHHGGPRDRGPRSRHDRGRAGGSPAGARPRPELSATSARRTPRCRVPASM